MVYSCCGHQGTTYGVQKGVGGTCGTKWVCRALARCEGQGVGRMRCLGRVRGLGKMGSGHLKGLRDLGETQGHEGFWALTGRAGQGCSSDVQAR